MRMLCKCEPVCALALLWGMAGLVQAETAPQYSWARRAGGAGDDRALAMALDAAGNAFIAGGFSGTTTIGSSTFTSSGLEDIFLAKYDSAGNFLWARQAGGTGDDYGLGVATDPAGNVYLTGSFQNTASFGSTSLTAHGNGPTRLSDVFVAKYSPAGNLLWASGAGGNGSDQALAIALDAQTNTYITGSFDASATFGTNSLANTTGNDNIFVAKLSSAGTFLWARKAGDSNTNNVGTSIALDGGANVYVTGYFGGIATFGSTSLVSAGTDSLPEAFLAKYDTGGNLLWAHRAGGPGDDRGKAVTADPAGNVSITGQFTGTATFSTTPLVANGSGPDIFVARYNSSGDLLWARRAGGNNAIYGDSGFGIATDAHSNAYVTGYFSGNATFGSNTLASVGFEDIFCSKYDAAGNLQWVRSGGGTLGNNFGYGLASDAQGNVFLAGFFLSSTLSFDNIILANSGGSDIFLAKLAAPIVPTLQVVASNGQVLLSWPAGATGFVLESSTSLASGTWSTVSTTPSIQGTNWLVAVPASEPWKCFRLRK